MYNWSVDEKKFISVDEVIEFLKDQPEVVDVSHLNMQRKGKSHKHIIKVRLTKDAHQVRKFTLAKIIEERSAHLPVSVIEIGT